jgi:hypothetical protein
LEEGMSIAPVPRICAIEACRKEGACRSSRMGVPCRGIPPLKPMVNDDAVLRALGERPAADSPTWGARRGRRAHDVQADPETFVAILMKRQGFLLRQRTADFRPGDSLTIREAGSQRSLVRIINMVIRNQDGLRPDWLILGLYGT